MSALDWVLGIVAVLLVVGAYAGWKIVRAGDDDR